MNFLKVMFLVFGGFQQFTFEITVKFIKVRFEIHVENAKAGLELYDYFFEVGKKYNIKPGAPNHAERIEGGLLSYGNDMLISDNPFECGFEKLVHLNDNVEFLGKDSLKKILKNGIKRKLMGVKINSDTLNLTSVDMFNKKKQIIGNLRSAAFSPTLKKIVGIAIINKEYCKNNEIFNINYHFKNINKIFDKVLRNK